MGRRRAVVLGLVLVCLSTFACNAIVGVEDVKLKSTPATPTGDDDDDSTPTGPDPVTPTPTGDAGGSDGGGTVTPACNGALDCERLVFVTKAAYDGNLGGTEGADQKCTAAGQTIPGYAGRTFLAWLSDSSFGASQRIPHGNKTYRRTDRSIFANSYSDMTDGTVNLPLYYDETGTALTGSAIERSVWTATKTDATWNGFDCNAWTSNASTDTGAYGDSQMADQNWTQVPGPATSTCDSLKHLYCVEY